MTVPSFMSPSQICFRGSLIKSHVHTQVCVILHVCVFLLTGLMQGLRYFESYHLFCLFALPNQSEQTSVLQDPYRDVSIFLVT